MRRAVLALVVAVVGLHAQPLGADEGTPGLAEARRRANAAAAEINRLESELGELDGELARLAKEQAAARAEAGRLRAQVAEIAVRRYTESGAETLFLPDVDLNEQERARALVRFVTGERTDTIDEFRAASARLGRASAELEAKVAAKQEALAELEAERKTLEAELERLEALEAARIEAERRAAEERARAEQVAAAAASSTTAVGTAGGPAAPGPGTTAGGPGRAAGGTATAPPPAPPAPAPPPSTGGGGWICPVQGARSFVDSWGAPRAGGRSHQGVDIMAPRGTPVVTPVAGTVTIKTGGIGGLTFRLAGVDGNWYYGAHLDAYSGAQGFLPAGTVVGYVGDTGDAKGTSPHLHFEIHLGGYGNPVNPYPTVARHC